jgi:autotransporter-associated beta strand protein
MRFVCNRMNRRKTRIARTRRVALISLALLGTPGSRSSAQLHTTTWFGSINTGSWAVASNWSNGVPGANSRALFASATPTLNFGGATHAAHTIDVLPQTGPTISNGTLVVNVFHRGSVAANAAVNTNSRELKFGDVQINGLVGGGTNPSFDVYFGISTLSTAASFTGRTSGAGFTLRDGGSLLHTSVLDLRHTSVNLRNNVGAPLQNRISDTAPVHMSLSSNLLLTGHQSTSVTERVGPIQIARGRTALGVFQATGAGANVRTTLHAPSLTREPGSSLSLLSFSPTTPNVFCRFDQAPTLVGAGVGPFERGILPFGWSQNTGTASFLTYDTGANAGDPADDVGLRSLDLATEFAPGFTDGRIQNVRVTSPATLSDTTQCNSLVINSGNIALANDARLEIQSGALLSTVAGASIAGTGAVAFGDEAIITLAHNGTFNVNVPILANRLTKESAGALRLTRPNSFSAPTSILAGEIESTVQGAIGDAGIFLAGRLRISGESQTYSGPLYFDGGRSNVTVLSVGTGFLHVDPGLTLTLNGPSSGAGQIFTRGTVILNGDGVYDSSIFWPFNTLELNGTIRAAQDQSLSLIVRNQPGAAYADWSRLIGTGTFAGEIALASGEVSPGRNGTGRLTVGSIVETAQVVQLKMELAGSDAATGYDQLAVLEASTLAPFQLDLRMHFSPALSSQFLIVDNLSAAPFSAPFRAMPEGSALLVDGVQFSISYLGGDGNDVVLTVVPEPAALSIVVSAFTLCRRRFARRRNLA